MKIWVHLFVLALFGCFSFNIFYHQVSRGGIYDTGMAGDVEQYLKIFNHEHPDSIPKQFRFRLLHVKLAEFIPDFNFSLFQFNSEQQVLFKFGIISLIAIVITCYLLWLFLIYQKVDPVLSAFLTIIWLYGFYVMNWIFQPLPDALSYLSIISCLFLWIQKKWWLLSLTFAISLFAKETVILIVLFQFLFNHSAKDRVIGVISILPGLIIFSWFKSLYPSDSGDILTFQRFADGIAWLFTPGLHHIYWLLSAWWAFQIIWIPVIIGYLLIIRNENYHGISRHILWIVPLILFFPILIQASTIGRLWQLGFPVFLLLAAEGIRWMLLKFNVVGISDTRAK